MPDLTRRVVVLTFLAAVGISMLAPLTARSAAPWTAATQHLLDAGNGQATIVDRGASNRERSASLSLAQVPAPIGPETLSPIAPPAPPQAAAMKATLYPRAISRVVPPPASGTTVTGRATWYCCSAGWRGQAVVALPGALGGHYDAPPAAHSVTVCADRCVVLPIVDYCGCSWGTANQKVADLSPEAWAAITDRSLSMGVVTVTLRFAS
ncbi:MAG TPA: hypothetical protein VK600_00735 [Candidatus Saccharimonadales bacterium]|nr:hypothetical protein [Candidatus Saccharimonadales bacterium]